MLGKEEKREERKNSREQWRESDKNCVVWQKRKVIRVEKRERERKTNGMESTSFQSLYIGEKHFL